MANAIEVTTDGQTILPVEKDGSGGNAVLVVGKAPSTGFNLLQHWRGFATDLYLNEVNSDDWLFSNNAYFDGSSWVQPNTSVPSTLYFMAAGGRGHVWYTAPAGGTFAWTPHFWILGSRDGRIYVGDDDSSGGAAPSWVHDGEGISFDHEEHPDKAWFQARGETSGEDTMAFFGPFGLSDDSANRLLAAEVPDHGFCMLVGNNVDQSVFFFYDLGASTNATVGAGLKGSTISLDGNVARTGSSGADNMINIGASSAGLDIENRAGGVVIFKVFIFGRG